MKIKLNDYKDPAWILLIPESDAEVYYLEKISRDLDASYKVDKFEDRYWQLNVNALGIYLRLKK